MSSVGRPSVYSRDLAISICAELIEGKSLKSICSRDDMPSISIVFKWLNDKDKQDFLDMYEMARENQADSMADEILDIADAIPLMNPVTGAIDGGSVQHQRLRVDARKWVASKLKPRKYGDKVQQEVTGAGGAPLLQGVQIKLVRPDADQ